MILDYNLIVPPWLCQPLIRMLPPQSNLDGIESDKEVIKTKINEKEVREFIIKLICYLI